MIGWLNGEAILSMLLTSISLAVAAIPEACTCYHCACLWC
jgi:Ca2+-transporting ATPase